MTLRIVVRSVVSGFVVACSVLANMSEVDGKLVVTSAVVISLTVVLGANAVVLFSVVTSCGVV